MLDAKPSGKLLLEFNYLGSLGEKVIFHHPADGAQIFLADTLL
jgi:hypothetical protein